MKILVCCSSEAVSVIMLTMALFVKQTDFYILLDQLISTTKCKKKEKSLEKSSGMIKYKTMYSLLC